MDKQDLHKILLLDMQNAGITDIVGEFNNGINEIGTEFELKLVNYELSAPTKSNKVDVNVENKVLEPIVKPAVVKKPESLSSLVNFYEESDAFWQFGEGTDLLIVTSSKDNGKIPFNTQEEVLLNNMLKALDEDVSKVSFICITEIDRDAIFKFKSKIENKIEQHRAPLMLIMGQFAADILLVSNGGFSENRGIPVNLLNKKTCITYHPSTLLNNSKFKQLSWRDILSFKVENL